MASRPLRVLHVLPTRDPAFGGPVSTTLELAEASTRIGLTSSVWPHDEHATFGRAAAYLPRPGAWQLLAGAVQAHDVIVVHGLWMLAGNLAAAVARRHRRPYIVSPHGMLDRWSMHRRAWKKQVYGAAFQQRDLDHAAALRFLNAAEVVESQTVRLRPPFFILPNGVSLDQLTPREPVQRKETVVIFLGRLHSKKGLTVLLPAFAQARRSLPELRLTLAGPDEGGFRRELERLVAQLGLADVVQFTGMLVGAHKLDALRSADLFVLPSFQEGDSSAVKEAMAAGLPVLLSPACHLPEAASSGAGLVVEPTVPELAQALVRLGSDRSALASMGRRARELVERDFGWDRLAAVFRNVCEDLVRGERASSAWYRA